MLNTTSLLRLSVLVIIGACASTHSLSAQQLFSFGNELDRIQLGLTPDQATTVFGQANQVEIAENGTLSMTYSEGDFAGLFLQFMVNTDSTQAAERHLSSALFSEPFALRTESGIGLGMNRAEVHAKIGAPLFKADMQSAQWESYQEGPCIVHVQYNLNGVVTHLYKVDRSLVHL